MKQKSHFLIPVLALLLCLAIAAATVFAVLFFDHSDSAKVAEYEAKWVERGLPIHRVEAVFEGN